MLLNIILFQPWQPTTAGSLEPLVYPFTVGNPEINIWNAWIYFFWYTFGMIGHLFTGGMGVFPFQWEYFWDNYLVATYYFGFEVCIVVAIISMIIFVKKCDPSWSFRAFLFMIGMLILISLTPYIHYLTDISHLGMQLGIPAVRTEWIILFTILGIVFFYKALSNLFRKKSRTIFYFSFAFFILIVGYTSAGLFATIPSFYFDSLSNSVVNLDIGSFITNPIFLAAFFTFLFLEITYLTAYNYTVAKPALERKYAIEEQLRELEQLGERSTEKLKAKAELHSISIRRFFSSEAFDFMREIIEKGIYDKEAQLRMASLRDYQHLQTYIEDLYIKDPEARNTLTAKGSLPSASRLAKASFIGTSGRIVAVLGLILLCFSPLVIFNALSFGNSSIVTSYLEIRTISAVIVITIPLVLLFPVIGTIIKQRRLPKIEEEKVAEKEKLKGIVAKRYGTA